ncbi:AraC family transcriptional regulator [Nocardia sp. CA2R105]|uniref:AraC family transcriptional regulator n=1 Tax=Nocardia coffeae TaxID=2873381 RepID=UPI001CA6C707|nr:AraC family transcriptional regulator [Nocardia coffeae]MBY8863084.1 AraC family transcriptional regulator [Nocardia coffeae]
MKPLARYAALNDYVALGQSLGLDPARLVREAGMDPASLSMQDRWVPASAVTELLERSAAESGREDFGLLLAERRRLSNLGPLGLVIREEPDVRSALELMVRHQHTYNESLYIRLTERNGFASVRLHLDVGERRSTRQATELAIGAMHGILRGFLGPNWQPAETTFAHPAPHDRTTHRRLFGLQLKFDHEFTGMTLYTTDLDTANPMSDPLLRPYAQQLLDSVSATAETAVRDRVQELVELLLPTGRCSVDQVARSLGVDRRTVHRRLADEGCTYSEILENTRVDLARRAVENQRRPFTEIADMLGFSSPASFTRWFRSRHGSSPSQWRAAAAAGADSVSAPAPGRRSRSATPGHDSRDRNPKRD